MGSLTNRHRTKTFGNWFDMNKRSFRQYKIARKIALVLAAAPLFQLSACQTGFQEVFAGVFNALPATLFNIFQGILLAPIQALISGGTTSI